MSGEATIQLVRKRLEDGGYTGLYYPGECACVLGDLAPCGSEEPDDWGWINGCTPGHRHSDPSGRTAEWVVSSHTTPPSQDEFDRFVNA